jgi:PAS domain S-box-containing protein
MNGSKTNDISCFEKSQLLYENSRDILLFVRLRDGRILEPSRAALEAYHYSRQELLSKTIFDLRASDTASEIITQMSTADHSGLLFETSHRRKDGTVFPAYSAPRGHRSFRNRSSSARPISHNASNNIRPLSAEGVGLPHGHPPLLFVLTRTRG